jgi:hypothetical protein
MGSNGHIIREIKAGMASFTSVEFVHERGNSNVNARRLAQSSIYDFIGWHVWLLSPLQGVCTGYYDI